MNEQLRFPRTRDYHFALGLAAGTALGAGLAVWLGPRASRAVDSLTRQGQVVRNDVADAVARGAHDVARTATEVERYATASKVTPRA